MKEEKGITLVALIITVIVIAIIIGVTVFHGSTLVNESKKEDIITTMLLIKSKTKIIKEKKDFGDIDNLVGIALANNTDYTVPSELSTELNAVQDGDFYILTQEDLDDMGIQVTVDTDKFYIVDYNNSEIYYSLGYEIDGTVEYSLSELDAEE